MCHAPHASANPALMIRPANEPCLACHVQIEQIIKTAKSQHEPVASGRCWECHTPHSSNYSPLLRANYPIAFYSPYSESNFALCFTCHDSALPRDERTTTLTDFRDGDRNLHFVHVNNPSRGRTCRACHEVHASQQDHHIRDGVPYGPKGWMLKINYTKLPNGGSCAKTCHETKAYNNKTLTSSAPK